MMTLHELAEESIDAYMRWCVPPTLPLVKGTLRNLYYAQEMFSINIRPEMLTPRKLKARMSLLAVAARNLFGYVQLPIDAIGCDAVRGERRAVSLRVIQQWDMRENKLQTRIDITGYGYRTREQIAKSNSKFKAYIDGLARLDAASK